MKILKQLFPSFLMLSALLFIGCNDEKPNSEPEPDPTPVTYSATFTVDRISEDFFTLGSFIVSYTDKDGKDDGMSIEKSQLPLSVTIDGLNENSALSFDLIYGYFPDLKLTKDVYTFERNISLTVRGSDKSMRSSTIKSGSRSIPKDRVQLYLNNVLDEDAYKTTVKRFITNSLPK